MYVIYWLSSNMLCLLLQPCVYWCVFVLEHLVLKYYLGPIEKINRNSIVVLVVYVYSYVVCFCLPSFNGKETLLVVDCVGNSL